jgi:hypothetical protein
VSVFKLQDESLQRVFDADFGDAFGEVRDVASLKDSAGESQIVTITASELKPDRGARLDLWKPQGLSLVIQSQRMVTLGDETRARKIILWSTADERRLLTVGFVARGEQILGQILDWGPLLGAK